MWRRCNRQRRRWGMTSVEHFSDGNIGRALPRHLCHYQEGRCRELMLRVAEKSSQLFANLWMSFVAFSSRHCQGNIVQLVRKAMWKEVHRNSSYIHIETRTICFGVLAWNSSRAGILDGATSLEVSSAREVSLQENQFLRFTALQRVLLT